MITSATDSGGRTLLGAALQSGASHVVGALAGLLDDYKVTSGQVIMPATAVLRSAACFRKRLFTAINSSRNPSLRPFSLCF